jgi:hypothetical protein
MGGGVLVGLVKPPRPASLGGSLLVLKQKAPSGWHRRGRESGAFSDLSRRIRYGYGNSYDHGYDVDGSFGGEGGDEIHEEENVGETQYGAGVKAGDEKDGCGG